MRQLPKSVRDAVAALPSVPSGCFVVISSSGNWGRGATADAAFRAASVAAKDCWVLWHQDAKQWGNDDPLSERAPHIDDSGALCWYGERPTRLAEQTRMSRSGTSRGARA